MTPRTVPIVCARAPRHIDGKYKRDRPVSAVRFHDSWTDETYWLCSRCGAQVKVVA